MTASICDFGTPGGRDEVPAGERRRLVQESYDKLYRLHARPLFGYLLRPLTLGDRREAEDYLQETFLRTWRWLQEHVVDPEIMRPWLYAVAGRIVIDGVRARHARPTEVSAADLNLTSQPDIEIDRLVQVHALRTALVSLSPEHRTTLIEIFHHPCTAMEAGDVLGVPEGTVKSRAYHAVQALRQATQAAEWDGHDGNLPAGPAGRRPARRAPSAQRAANDGPKPTREVRYQSAGSRPEAPAAA